MWNIFAKSLQTGVVTTGYPQTRSSPPERFRGRPELRPGGSIRLDTLPEPACCPSGAIEARAAEGARPAAWRLDIARCVFCGRCADASQKGAVTLTRDFELAARRREDLVIEASEAAIGHDAPVATPAAGDRESPGEVLRHRIERVLGRSLHLRHLDAGSCNACDWELNALLNPIYDVQRLGIDFVASPRHADGVMVTGPITRNLEIAVRRTWEAVPEPRVAIAVGACACSGGIVGAGYASAGGAGAVLPVDVHIPGCPPRPEAIIFGLLLAMGRLEQRIAAGRIVAAVC